MSNEAIIAQQAFNAAKSAANDYIAEYGMPMWPCGFASVIIKPGNCRFANYLKKAGLARKDSYNGGVRVYNPSGHMTQNMDVKVAGADAFVSVLTQNGIKAYTDARMD